MERKFKIVTLCGSTKFKDDFLKVQSDLTLKGIIVMSLGIFTKVDTFVKPDEGLNKMLNEMHKQRIDISDGIFVINKNGYIGENTKMEIKYAQSQGKTIEYLEPIQ